MKKKLLLVLMSAVLIIAGAFGVWANEQAAVQPGCSKCAKAETAPVQAQPGCPNCAKQQPADGNAAAPCPNCVKAGVDCPNTPNCPNCPKAGAEVKAVPGCANCAKLKQPAEQPAQKPCCNKGNNYQPL